MLAFLSMAKASPSRVLLLACLVSGYSALAAGASEGAADLSASLLSKVRINLAGFNSWKGNSRPIPSVHVHFQAGPHHSLMATARPQRRLSQVPLQPRHWQPLRTALSCQGRRCLRCGRWASQSTTALLGLLAVFITAGFTRVL